MLLRCFWANPALFLVYFRPFLIAITITVSIINVLTLKKHRWCAWDSNPGHRMVGADETMAPARDLKILSHKMIKISQESEKDNSFAKATAPAINFLRVIYFFR